MAAWAASETPFNEHGQLVLNQGAEQIFPLFSDICSKIMQQVVQKLISRLSTPPNSGIHVDFKQQIDQRFSQLAMQEDKCFHQLINGVVNKYFTASSSADGGFRMQHESGSQFEHTVSNQCHGDVAVRHPFFETGSHISPPLGFCHRLSNFLGFIVMLGLQGIN